MKLQRQAKKLLKPVHYEFAQAWGLEAAKTAKKYGLNPFYCKKIAFAVVLLETCYNLKLEVPEEIKEVVYELAHTKNYSFLKHCIDLVDNSNLYTKYMFEKKLKIKQNFSQIVL